MRNHRLAGLAAAVVLLSACGGGGGGGNAAAGRSFTYGAPLQASPEETQLLDGPVSMATALQGQPDALGGAAFADFTAISTTLLGATFEQVRLVALKQVAPAAPDEALRLAASAPAAMPVTGFDDPACVAETPTSATLTRCTITSGTVDSAVVTTIDGFVRVPAPGSVAWDLAVRLTMTSPESTTIVTTHQAGTVELTDTTLVAAMRTEMDATVRSGLASVSIGVDEALDIDVTYQAGPPACITGGTLEAKRVWTRRPSGYGPAQLPDGAARVTWTGCGTGTVEFSP